MNRRPASAPALACRFVIAGVALLGLAPLAQAQTPEGEVAAGEGLRIVGGVAAADGTWPSLVSVQIQRGGGRVGLCGGTVIDRQWVLTAAHCLIGPAGVATPPDVTIVEGTADLRRGGRRIGVAQIIPHPQYRAGAPGQPFDVGLLRLAEASRVEPQALLAGEAAARVLQAGEIATVAGFGGTQPVVVEGPGPQLRPTGPQQGSPRLLQVNVPLVSTDRCRRSYGDRIDSRHICAGFEEGGRDSCQGDSGGPLYMLGPVGRPLQVGVVSWGAGCGQPGRFGVYAAIPAYEAFIRGVVRDARFVGAAPPPVATAQPPAAPALQATAAARPPGQAPRPPNPARPVLAAGEPVAGTPPGLVGQVSLDILPGERIRVGEAITLRIQSGVAGTLMVFSIDETGRATQLFPNRQSAPTPMAFRAATTMRPGSILPLPGPADGFVLRARPPVGENVIVAVIAPPGVPVEAILSRHMDLAAIPDAEGFFAELAAILDEARSRLPPITSAPEEAISRGIARPIRAPIPMAERRFTIVER